MTEELSLRRRQAINPHWFDMMHRRWVAQMRAAAEARFPVVRDDRGRFAR